MNRLPDSLAVVAAAVDVVGIATVVAVPQFLNYSASIIRHPGIGK